MLSAADPGDMLALRDQSLRNAMLVLSCAPETFTAADVAWLAKQTQPALWHEAVEHIEKQANIMLTEAVGLCACDAPPLRVSPNGAPLLLALDGSLGQVHAVVAFDHAKGYHVRDALALARSIAGEARIVVAQIERVAAECFARLDAAGADE
jgi:hypothetical protein